MKRTNITHVCLVETVYSLFLYMLLVTKEELKNTFFFCSDMLPSDIAEKLPYHHRFKLPSKRYCKWIFRIVLYWTSKWRWPFIRKSQLYGSDNYLFSSGIIGDNKITLIEDGASNYSLLPANPHLYWIRKILMGRIAASGCGGVSPNVRKVILTGLLPIPERIKDKVEIVSVEKRWGLLPADYKHFILDFFDSSVAEMEKMKNYTAILFTQPMYEDGLISKEDELALYQQLLSGCDIKSLVIKVHPRDTIDYGAMLPGAYIFSKKIPMELLNILGVRFKDVYTVFSTAALSLPYKANIHFMGTSVHPNLLKCRGKIEYHAS